MFVIQCILCSNGGRYVVFVLGYHFQLTDHLRSGFQFVHAQLEMFHGNEFNPQPLPRLCVKSTC